MSFGALLVLSRDQILRVMKHSGFGLGGAENPRRGEEKTLEGTKPRRVSTTASG
jgi:hypothetical protein